MRILIVDDEPLARARLVALLDRCPDVGPIAAVEDGEAALAACAEHAPDLLLADINMPGMDGTMLTRRLADLSAPPQVVFCTAYAQFAARAYALGAADYLLKPVGLERLHAALERAQRLRVPRDGRSVRPALTVHMAGSERRIPLHDVFCLLAGDKYVTVHHAHGEDLTDTSLRRIEQQHPDTLVRLHRDCLVPRQRLLGLASTGDGTRARLAGTDVRPHVSRRNLAGVRKVLRG